MNLVESYGANFPGWDRMDRDLSASTKHPYPAEYLGIERQKVREDDILERRRRAIARWTTVKAERSRQWGTWGELTDHVMPELGRFITSDHNMPKNTSQILNNTPTRMARSLAAGLLAGHTSPARPWLNLTVADPDLAEWGPMRLALFELNRRVRLIFELSGLYKVLAMGIYPGLATFGLGTCVCEEDFRRVLRFVPFAIGTYGIAGDGQNNVDTLITEEAWSVAELVKVFGWDNVSRSVRIAWNGNWYDQYVAVLRMICPNEEYIPGAIGPRGSKFGSVHMEIGGLLSASAALSQPSTDPVLGFLREERYEENPILCARWTTTSRDIYPTGPGHDALDDARMLKQLEKRKLLAISKGVNPTMLLPDALRQSRNTMLPGDAVYYPTGMSAEIKPAYEVDPRWVTETRAEAQAAMERIGQAFFADLMLLFTQQSPGEGKQPRTAQEIAAKQQEKMLMLGPVLENINEFLTQLVERTLGIMARRRLMPKFPREAGKLRLKVEFISPLAQAQKLLMVQTRERFVQFVGQVAQLKGQTALDKLNGDKFIDRQASDLGINPDEIEDQEQVQAIRAERAKQAQIQQQAQALLTASDAAKNLGKVPMDTDNMMTRMVGQPGATEAGGAV